MEYCNVIVVESDILSKNTLVIGENTSEVAEKAEELFLELCKEYDVNFEEDIDKITYECILDEGYYECGLSTIFISWPELAEILI